jgi:S-DNA-T family DNA segregation ATPase FtsK/SpoIIIE
VSDEPARPARLPAVPADAELAEDVVDGEIVDEPEPEPERPKVVVLAPVVQVLQTINVIVQHPAAKTTARHASYPLGGLVILARRRKRTRAQRMAQMAEMAGDHANALLWEKHQAEQAQKRHDRWKDRIRLIPWIAGIVLALMIVTGVALGATRRSLPDLIAPFTVTFGVIADLWAVAAVLWLPLLLASPFVTAAVLHEVGRRGGDQAPNWARTAGDADVDHEITELLLTNALKNMRFPQVTDYLKLGQPLQFVVGCRQEGRGTYSEIRLPGLAAEKVVRRRADYAAGVHRAAKEVWPSVGAEAAILRTWIADKGALEEGAGPYPLLDEGFTDVFKGLPFGRTLKGDLAYIPVIGRNSIDGGMPEQGKSNGARVVACGYTLDIGTEVRIYVPDTNFDFEAFKPRCSRYLMGAEDEVIERMLEEQELLKEELQRRGQLLVDHGVQEVTARIARAGVGLHPVFVLVEEAHVPITHKKFGKDFAQLLGENVKLDRKRGVHIKVSTQAPVRGAMPRDVTTNCTVGVAYALADIYANDAILGPGAHSAGHRATELIPGTDRGIALCKGFAGEARSEMIQAYRVDTAQVPPMVQRAMAALAADGRPVPGTGTPLAIASRDLLGDLADVTEHRSGKVRLSELPDLLHNLAPSWGAYRGLTGVQLRRQLLTEGVPTTNPGNVPTLDLDDLRRVIAEREVS